MSKYRPLLLLAPLLFVAATPPAFSANLAEFVPVDTSRLMGSPDPPRPFELEPVFPHLSFRFPVEVTHAGDGSDRLFVVCQEGAIYVFPNQREAREKKMFLDLSQAVARTKFEEGLLALEFHPKYAENGEFYVYYSVRPLATRLSRFRVSADDPDVADPGSEEVLLEIPQPFWNHNSGSLKFGNDGLLYIALGDGGAADDPHGNAQNPKSLLGSVLRIDVDGRDEGLQYAVPEDNPFVEEGDRARPETWAFGFRNPWKMSVDRQTGTLWMADVGQDLWEEVNVVRRGGNYGWRIREGAHDFAADAPRFNEDFIDPVFEYPHSEGRSITGGAVYRGPRLPEISGWYLCADWQTGHVWGLDWDGEKVANSRKIARSDLAITAFGEDEAGEVYLLATDEQATISVTSELSGSLYRLRRAPQRFVYDPEAFPRHLSETGLFQSVADHVPVDGAIPYDLNVPFWSDSARKLRFIALPGSGQVVFSHDGNWDFPVGSVIAKTFVLDVIADGNQTETRLETRLMVRNPLEWVGYTYLWNDEQSDATLIDGHVQKTYRVPVGGAELDQIWHFPSRTECMLCHTKNKNFVLGLNTRQLNRAHTVGERSENQLSRLERLGVLTEDLPSDPYALGAYPDWRAATEVETTGDLNELARAYLDVNCSMCHSPGGKGWSPIDLQFHTPLARAGLLRESVPATAADSPTSVIPGDSEQSGLVDRISRRPEGPGRFVPGQMPPLASRVVDANGTVIIRAWIDAMKDE